MAYNPLDIVATNGAKSPYGFGNSDLFNEQRRYVAAAVAGDLYKGTNGLVIGSENGLTQGTASQGDVLDAGGYGLMSAGPQ